MIQRTLFDTDEPLARATDPQTSHAGAESIRPHLARLQAEIAAMVQQTPHLTSLELAQRHGVDDPRKINRRLGEMERRGLVLRGAARRCSVSGRMAAVWVAV